LFLSLHVLLSCLLKQLSQTNIFVFLGNPSLVLVSRRRSGVLYPFSIGMLLLLHWLGNPRITHGRKTVLLRLVRWV
jgi:hypothetical protein